MFNLKKTITANQLKSEEHLFIIKKLDFFLYVAFGVLFPIIVGLALGLDKIWTVIGAVALLVVYCVIYYFVNQDAKEIEAGYYHYQEVLEELKNWDEYLEPKKSSNQ